jgi:hypothetical protein
MKVTNTSMVIVDFPQISWSIQPGESKEIEKEYLDMVLSSPYIINSTDTKTKSVIKE